MTISKNINSKDLMKSIVQRIATGPELSKNISREEAKKAMESILQGEITDVRSAIFLIALRMKRETQEENLGVQDAINESIKTIDIDSDSLINIADPYDGFTRNIPSSAFIPSVLAELGLPTMSQGVESVGPKFGCTHHLIFKLLGKDVLNNHEQLAERLLDKNIGWGYLDQKIFSPGLYDLMNLRTEIIKRPLITTIEVLANPIISRKNHFVTGYVHKPYPPIYLMLAKNAKFDTAIVIRGTEGGIVPSLRQNSKSYFYKEKSEDDQMIEINPEKDIGIIQTVRAVQIPDSFSTVEVVDKIQTKVNPEDLAKEAIKLGIEALSGKDGPMSDCILYGAVLILHHVTGNTIKQCTKEVRSVLKSKSAANRLKK